MPTITTETYLAARGKRDRARNYAREATTRLQTVADLLAMPDHARITEDATCMMDRSFSRVLDQNALPTRDQVADALRDFTNAEDAFLVADTRLTVGPPAPRWRPSRCARSRHASTLPTPCSSPHPGTITPSRAC